MGKTNIEWTSGPNGEPGRTWNPVTGCDKISPGCKHCYAETIANRFWKDRVPVNSAAGITDRDPDPANNEHFRQRKFTDVRCHPDRLEQPLHWRKPSKVFVNSMSDLFHEDVPREFIADVFGVMAVATHVFWGGPRNQHVGVRTEPGKPPVPLLSFGTKYGPHIFQVLTKRPGRMNALINDPRFQAEVRNRAYHHAYDRIDAGYLADRIRDGRLWPLPNVWLGVSVENQEYADKRIPLLLQTPAAVRFVSYEPALGPVDFLPWLREICGQCGKGFADSACGPTHAVIWGMRGQTGNAIGWLICGGESGPKARPCDRRWFYDAARQCQEVGVHYFVKQLGAKSYIDNLPEYTNGFLDMDDKKGGDWLEWPADLRVREFPEVTR